MDKSIYAALTAAASIAPPSLEDAAKEASMAPYLIGWGGVGGVFLAGLILGALITYLVIEKLGLSRTDVEDSGDPH
jgi:predicted lipid-binding transport protein (Tim44 family)